MGTSRTFLQNASTRHAVFVQRFAGGQIREIIPFLERAQREALAALAGTNLTNVGKRRQKALLRSLDEALEGIYEDMSTQLTDNMLEFGESEAEFSTRMFTKGTDADFSQPATATIQAAVLSTPIAMVDDKMKLDTALRQFSRQKRRELVGTIQDGVIAGKTNEEIIRDVTFVTNKIQKNHASALVRTVTNHVSATARQITVSDNADIVDRVEWVSTLDGATTHTCQSLDGKVFPKSSGPRPPIHWGCRSTVIPIVKEEFSIKDRVKSERPAVGPDGAETVQGKATYNTWLRDQPKAFQEEVLGRDRAALFRKGNLPVTKFVDRNFEPLTLEQLKRKEPLAFEKAGLE